MGYHFSGLISALFVVLSLTGLALQVRFIWRRKRDFRKGQLVDERPTSILSLNRFSTSFLAFYLKDISSMIFGAVMGFKDGWPVLVFHGVSMTVQCTTMWHFRWVRVSPVALERRETYDTQSNTNRTRRGGRTVG